jgi:AbrB family looped-hinge helix DNA binding protein
VETYSARLEKSGRILIPAAVRRTLGLAEGSMVVVKVESSGEIGIISRSQALAKAREDLRKHIPPGRDLVEELIQDRRREAAEMDNVEAARS